MQKYKRQKHNLSITNKNKMEQQNFFMRQKNQGLIKGREGRKKFIIPSQPEEPKPNTEAEEKSQKLLDGNKTITDGDLNFDFSINNGDFPSSRYSTSNSFEQPMLSPSENNISFPTYRTCPNFATSHPNCAYPPMNNMNMNINICTRSNPLPMRIQENILAYKNNEIILKANYNMHMQKTNIFQQELSKAFNALSSQNNPNSYLLEPLYHAMSSKTAQSNFSGYNQNMNNLGFNNEANVQINRRTQDPNANACLDKLKQKFDFPQKRSIDPKNLISVEKLLNGTEKRTTVRLYPIPPKYSGFDMHRLIDKEMGIETSKQNRIYDAIYVPPCKVIGRNLGFCFINFIKPEFVVAFYNIFYGKILGKKKCKKPCTIIFADKQGKEAWNNTEELELSRRPLFFTDTQNANKYFS